MTSFTSAAVGNVRSVNVPTCVPSSSTVLVRSNFATSAMDGRTASTSTGGGSGRSSPLPMTTSTLRPSQRVRWWWGSLPRALGRGRGGLLCLLLSHYAAAIRTAAVTRSRPKAAFNSSRTFEVFVVPDKFSNFAKETGPAYSLPSACESTTVVAGTVFEIRRLQPNRALSESIPGPNTKSAVPPLIPDTRVSSASSAPASGGSCPGCIRRCGAS